MKYIKESFHQQKHEIEEFLKDQLISLYQINDDLSIDVYENVHLSGFIWKELPFKFNYIEGNLDLFDLGLTNLKGCPDIVGGYFDCSGNELTSLEFGPSKVGDVYHCYENKLTNLDFLPTDHIKELHCYKNKITSIKECPNTDNFIYYDNPIYTLIYLLDCFTMKDSIEIIIDKLNEFEVIKDNKLDLISLNSLYDYYNKKFDEIYFNNIGYIKSYKIFEKLGILSSLEEIADKILIELSKDDYYLLETDYKGNKIKINCYLTTIEKMSGFFKVISKDEFEISTDKLDKSTIIHELKHLDYAISRSLKVNHHHYISHVGRKVINDNKSLLRNKFSKEVLSDILYLIDPDEFQAYFNDFYTQLKEDISDDMSDEEKRKVIDDFLDNQNIYFYYKYYRNSDFDINKFFRTNNELEKFLKELLIKLDQFLKDKSSYYESKSILNKIVNLLQRFKPEKKLSNDMTSLVNQINNIINREVRRNYKKFFRLYSLFI